MRPHPRGAETDPSDPRAWGTCERCGFVLNLYKLRWQLEWRGVQLYNTRHLVCEWCEDTPQRQLGTIFIPPDPLPVINARVEQYNMDEEPVSTRYTMKGQIRVVRYTPYPIMRIVNTVGNVPATRLSALAGNTIPVVTNIGATAHNGSGGISLSGVNVPPQSLIIVIGAAFGATGGTVSDGTNNYTALTPNTGSNFDGTTLFYAPNASLSGGTITYTPNGGGFTRAMSAFYASNIALTNPLDAAVTASATGNGNTPSVTSSPASQVGELFVGIVGGDGQGASAASMIQDTGDGWSFPPNFSVDSSGAGAYVGGGVLINPGTGTQIFAPTLSHTGGAGFHWVAAIYGFKHW